ncbi:MAG: AsmA family protein [Sulfuricaulis sp.]|uniref:AsmA family protein n=1 Tax=Sulfuricaulis sp. TaxID=2003553 RepID=UPI0025DD1F3F|nr:AsmA family protein [Sulfuricaulis sp.]MCR4348085.1 AsmA family protein [Sulfuricaulis sp.]
MSKTLKITFYVVGGLVGLFVLVAVALLLFVDADSNKPRLEAAASEALGMEVSVGGSLEFGFFPGLHVTLEDAHIRNRGVDLVSASRASLGIDLLPLLRKEIRIGKITLKRPAISIERDLDGKFNFENPDTAGKTLAVLDLAKVSLSDATLVYTDKQSGGEFKAGGCHVDVRHLRFPGGKSPDLLMNLSFTAELSCKEIRNNDFTMSDLKFSADGKNGVFNLKPVTMHIFGAQGSGSMQADFSGAVPLYHVRYALPQFHVEEFLKMLSPQKMAEGTMNFSANLSMQGKTAREMKQTADGDISLRGENLTFHGSDLDKEFARFKSSQNFSLVDAGAFFFVGPLGLAATKGYDFAGILRKSGGRSEIRTVVSDWKFQHGMAQAQDVAMATKQNRVALAGRLDFINEQFDDMTMALIDAKGCATVRQKIRGPFQKPVVEKPNILKSLAGPALKLLKKGRGLFPGGECEVFYAGSVAPPK